MNHFINYRTIISLLFLLQSTLAMGASVTVTPSGSQSYQINGSGMDGVAGIQLDIAYDTASLSTPTVTQGALVSGAMLAANTSRPGIIKIAIISTRSFSGNGQIATISFASKTGNGGITSITSSMIDSKGTALAASTSNLSTETAASGSASTPGVPFSQTAQQASSSVQTQFTSAPATSSTVATATPTYLGTVTLPTDPLKEVDPQPEPSSAAPDNTEEPLAIEIAEQINHPVKPNADTKNEETPQYVAYKGILDRFKQYKGSKLLSSIVTIFDRKVAQSINQEPAILVSDNQSKATLTIDLPAGINSSPNFAVNGGKLVSFKQDKQIKRRWIVEVLPDGGSLKVTVTIIAGTEDFEYPLTVVPPVKTALTLDEKGWSRFLKEVGTTKAPLHDLNSDGMRNYVDEFIFVANYLASKATSVIPASTSNKSVK